MHRSAGNDTETVASDDVLLVAAAIQLRRLSPFWSHHRHSKSHYWAIITQCLWLLSRFRPPLS